MSAADILQPFLLILGVIAVVAAAYFIVTAIKGRMASQHDADKGGKHRAY